ncbi:MAG TPA: flagellar biosynthesis protein FlgJ [Rhodospirillaceae bacterium]|nr:flagellar biosynthesis protein FlgJ [Rhodospirillaceae bacterium]
MENVSGINTAVQYVAPAQTGKARVVAAIQAASVKSGVDFTYLLNKASQESDLNPTAKAGSSSATGLYQFIDQTWLKTIKASGEKYGLGEIADKISIGSNGVASVANAADKKAILALRTNPEVAANMAAELANINKEELEKKVGGKIGSTEMYMAHFLGSGGASTFLNAMKENPSASAADLLPQAAAANKSVFYDQKTGEARSVSEIYAKFAAKFDKTPDISGVMVASAKPSYNATTQAQAEVDVATNITMASFGQTSSGGMKVGGMSLSPTTTSSFATMVLAQMDMETLGLEAMDKTYKFESNSESRKRSVLDTLANAA